ncbi:MAG TPA: 50S ribosomal protein L24 [Candidatus Acidoferrum sp.]|jgi:large subunit ribosomal protein L24|nr:50S ribosomal protein L24 [Candidatus Acidoferrum sp.]
MQSFHVKKNDDVVVIAGAFKGKRGRVIAVDAKKHRLIVEGVHMIKKHMRKSQQYPQGQIIEREGSIHISNVMKGEKYDVRASRRAAVTPAETPAA